MKSERLVQQAFSAGSLVMGCVLLLFQDFVYGSAEAYCKDIEGRWVNSAFMIPIQLIVLAVAAVWFGWLLHKAGKE